MQKVIIVELGDDRTPEPSSWRAFRLFEVEA
jgi:hypothetical protein